MDSGFSSSASVQVTCSALTCTLSDLPDLPGGSISTRDRRAPPSLPEWPHERLRPAPWTGSRFAFHAACGAGRRTGAAGRRGPHPALCKGDWRRCLEVAQLRAHEGDDGIPGHRHEGRHRSRQRLRQQSLPDEDDDSRHGRSHFGIRRHHGVDERAHHGRPPADWRRSRAGRRGG